MQTLKAIRRFFLFSSILLLASGCSSAPAEENTKNLFETNFSEKLFRSLLAESGTHTGRRVCLAFGNPLKMPARNFLDRFDDLKERLIRLDQIRVKGLGKGYREDMSGSPVVIYQIRQIIPLAQNRHVMEAAWFCCSRHSQKGLYEVAVENGKYRITRIRLFDRCRHYVTLYKQQYFSRRVVF